MEINDGIDGSQGDSGQRRSCLSSPVSEARGMHALQGVTVLND